MWNSTAYPVDVFPSLVLPHHLHLLKEEYGGEHVDVRVPLDSKQILSYRGLYFLLNLPFYFEIHPLIDSIIRDLCWHFNISLAQVSTVIRRCQIWP